MLRCAQSTMGDLLVSKDASAVQETRGKLRILKLKVVLLSLTSHFTKVYFLNGRKNIKEDYVEWYVCI